MWPIAVHCQVLYLVKSDKDFVEKATKELFDKTMSQLNTYVDPKTGKELVDLKYNYLQISAVNRMIETIES